MKLFYFLCIANLDVSHGIIAKNFVKAKVREYFYGDEVTIAKTKIECANKCTVQHSCEAYKFVDSKCTIILIPILMPN